MSNGANTPPADVAALTAAIEALNKEIRTMDRGNRRGSASPLLPFGTPPPPSAIGAAGPMMMAWMLSWMFSSSVPNPSMYQSMAHFAADREEFWHELWQTLTVWALQSGATAEGSADKNSPASEENLKKITAALAKEGIDQKVADMVVHAIKTLDALERLRSKVGRKGKN